MKNDSLYVSGVLWALSQSFLHISAARPGDFFFSGTLAVITIERSRLMVPAGLPGMAVLRLSGAG